MLARTEPQIFLDGLGEELRAFPFRSQLAFAAALCERHLAAYVSFSQAENWGDPHAMRDAIDASWSMSLKGTAADQLQIKNMMAKCAGAVPDSEDFSTPLTEDALSAGVMVLYLIEFMGTRDAEAVVQIASLARDIADAKVQITEDLNPADSKLEQRIADHPLMVAELAAMKCLLAKLNKAGDTDDLTRFKDIATSQA